MDHGTIDGAKVSLTTEATTVTPIGMVDTHNHTHTGQETDTGVWSATHGEPMLNQMMQTRNAREIQMELARLMKAVMIKLQFKLSSNQWLKYLKPL